MDDGDLAFLPLGGTGEIGMNLNLYRFGGPGKERWLAIDCGIGFGGSEHPEAEVMMPDPAFIADRHDDLAGLVITHAHEDHIGAVAWLWPRSRRMWVAGWGLVACLVSIQAYARIYNLEHWLTDVLGGILFGTVLLVVMTSCLRILDLPPAQSARDASPAGRRQAGIRPRTSLSRSSYGA